MKNFHWGKALTLYFILFIGLLGWIVYKSMQMDHSLVAEDYYALDLAYQEHFDMSTNQKKYYPKAKISYDPPSMTVIVDLGDTTTAVAKGHLKMYRASDKSRDRKVPFIIQAGQSQSTMPMSDLVMGKWSVQVDWESQGRSYYLDDIILVPDP